MTPALSVVVTPRSSLEADCLAQMLEASGFTLSLEQGDNVSAVVLAIPRSLTPTEAVELLEEAAESSVATLVLVDDDVLAGRARSLGLAAVSWHSTNASIAHAVRAVCAGNALSAATAAVRRADDVFVLLTEREREVMALVARGSQDSEIASSLGISINTVRTYVQQSLQKLGAPHRHAAAALVWSSSLMDSVTVGVATGSVGAVAI